MLILYITKEMEVYGFPLPRITKWKTLDVHSGVCSTDLFSLAYTDACVESKQTLLQIAHKTSDTVLKRCSTHCATTFTHRPLTCQDSVPTACIGLAS